MGTWKKILYRKQPFPDNYSGGKEQFLKELRKNVSVVQYKYWDAVVACCNLVFHVNTVILFYIAFEKVSGGFLAEEPLLLGSYSLLLGFYALHAVFLSPVKLDFLDHAFTLAALVLYGFGLTPIIRTLTTTISTDTVYATSFFTAFMSCVFHDYGVRAPIVSMPLSASSGLCSAIFLLSRLESNSSAFALLSSAFAIHACSSYVRNAMFRRLPLCSASLTAASSIATTVFLQEIYPELAAFILFCQAFVVFACPAILIIKQRGKRTIHGPWDEAVLTGRPGLQ